MLNPTNRTGLSTHISVTTHTKPKRTDEKGKKAPSLCIFPSYRHTSTQRPQAQTLSYQNKRRYLFCPLAIFMPFFFINNRVCLWSSSRSSHTNKKWDISFSFTLDHRFLRTTPPPSPYLHLLVGGQPHFTNTLLDKLMHLYCSVLLERFPCATLQIASNLQNCVILIAKDWFKRMALNPHHQNSVTALTLLVANVFSICAVNSTVSNQ